MKKAIVSFYDNKERYILGKIRQEQSLKSIGWDGDYFAFNSYEEIGSPTHDEVPYAFKPYAIKKVKDMGYDLVIWMDSPVYATKQLNQFISAVSSHGVMLFDNIGFTIGDYTSDKCLDVMGMDRNESFNHQMIMACVMGFDFNDKKANDFFNEYYEYTNVDGAYQGAWDNPFFEVSKDARVKGHRHDQSVASILAVKYGVKLLHPNKTFFAYFGNAGHLPHAESVCLISHGY